MTAEELTRHLSDQRILSLEEPEWAALSGQFALIESHDTVLAGELCIISTLVGPAAVEQPKPDRRVIRLLSDETEVRQFVQERMDTYDRMWDGCGCKVDYYS